MLAMVDNGNNINQYQTLLRVGPVGAGGEGGDGGDGGEGGEGGDGGEGGAGEPVQRSDGIVTGFQSNVAASHTAFASPDPDVQVYVSIVPIALPLFEAVAPFGAAGASEAHSPSAEATIPATTLPLTVHV